MAGDNVDIKTWFPLAVASAELMPELADTEAMLRELQPFIAEAERESRLYAWTGDVNGCSDLHIRPAFQWLRGRVEEQVGQFIQALGFDTERVRPYFQSSWPVISNATEAVASHTHMSASLSVVYYLKIPPGDGGTLIFENVGRPNAIVIGSSAENSLQTQNELNRNEALYKPKAGQLLIFPSRQPHKVKPHRSSELRVSITFDVALLELKADGTVALGLVEDSWDPFQ